MSDRFAELLDAYWAAAYQQGKDGRTHDDKDGSAQVAESNLCHFVDSLRVDVDEANARIKALEEENARLKHERDVWREKSGGIAVQPVLDSLHAADARVKRLVEALGHAQEEFDRISCEGVTETKSLHDAFDRMKIFADRGASSASAALAEDFAN